MSEEKPQQDISEIKQIANNAINQIDQTTFSPSAFATLKDKIGEYIENLINESVKISRRHQADTVSSAHVQRAAEYLVAITSRRFFRHLGTVGGIILGASLSNILSMVGNNSLTSLGVLVSVALVIVGASMITLHIGKD
jgi:histone H3/H4